MVSLLNNRVIDFDSPVSIEVHVDLGPRGPVIRDRKKINNQIKKDTSKMRVRPRRMDLHPTGGRRDSEVRRQGRGTSFSRRDYENQGTT